MGAVISTDAIYTLSIGFVAILVVRSIVVWIRRPNYPPGPRKIPFLGNLLDVPDEEAWVTYFKWRETCGDVVYMELMGTPIIILNSYQACWDLLEKRSDIYSDRVGLIVSTKLMSWANAVTLAPYGDRWRRYRRITAQSLRKEAIKDFHPIQEQQVAKYLGMLLDAPQDFIKNFRFIAGRSLLWNIYGVKIDTPEDPIITTAEKAMDVGVYAAQPGNFLVDVFPALLHIPKWFPGTGWKEWARKGDILVNAMVDMPFDRTVEDMKKGGHHSSFTSTNLEKGEESDLVKWCAGTMYTAGIDTSVASIRAFVLAMILYPDIQKRGQAEIDAVCGTDRLPGIEDREEMPYVNAIIKEILRWQPALPMALPHRLMKDDIYKGYFLPAGAIVLGSTWAITRDPEHFPDPERFDPERYMPLFDKTGSYKQEDLPIDSDKFAYGYGRRICAGMHYADSMLFISISRILSSFHMSEALDGNGNKITPELNFTKKGVIRESLEYPCSIQPRSVAHKALILSSLSGVI